MPPLARRSTYSHSCLPHLHRQQQGQLQLSVGGEGLQQLVVGLDLAHNSLRKGGTTGAAGACEGLVFSQQAACCSSPSRVLLSGSQAVASA